MWYYFFGGLVLGGSLGFCLTAMFAHRNYAKGYSDRVRYERVNRLIG